MLIFNSLNCSHGFAPSSQIAHYLLNRFACIHQGAAFGKVSYSLCFSEWSGSHGGPLYVELMYLKYTRTDRNETAVGMTAFTLVA